MNGFLNVFKPPGVSSAKAIAALKRRVYPDKIGHLGTLDPLAAGVLPVAVGKATRLFDYFLTKKKRYLAHFVFGEETDTLDADGRVVKALPASFTERELRAAAAHMVGEQMQLPPAYSAVSVNGRRAYDLARSGGEVELKAKPVTVYGFDILRAEKTRCLADLTVSGGTYIRSIVRDLAKALGTCGYLGALLRVESGSFRLENARTVEELGEDVSPFLIPITEALKNLPKLEVAEAEYGRLANGVKLFPENPPQPPFTVWCRGELFGLGNLREDGGLALTAYLK